MQLHDVHRGRVGAAWSANGLVVLEVEDAGDGSRSRAMLALDDLEWLIEAARVLREERASYVSVADAAKGCRITAERVQAYVARGIVRVARLGEATLVHRLDVVMAATGRGAKRSASSSGGSIGE